MPFTVTSAASARSGRGLPGASGLILALLLAGLAFDGAAAAPAGGDTGARVAAAVSAAPAVAAAAPFDLADAARIAAGRKRFNKTCAGYCHGHEGVGGRAPDFRGRSDLAPQLLFDTISNGREGADVMPPWGAAYSAEQIWELVAYLMHLGRQRY